MRRAFVLLVALAIIAFQAAGAQTRPATPPAVPPGGLPNIPQLSGPNAMAKLQAMIQSSGMTLDQIRARLRAEGYPQSLLDSYMLGAIGDSTMMPGDDVFAAMRVLGMGDTTQLDSLRLMARSPRELKARSDSAFLDTLTRAAHDDSTRAAIRRLLRSREAQTAYADSGYTVFGVDLFQRETSQFNPNLGNAIGPNYRLGPGDQLVLVITGDVEKAYTRLEVTRDGFLIIPEVGQVSVTNLTLGQLEDQLYTKLGRLYSGIRRGPGAPTHFSINVSRVGSNQVVVTGDVRQPGAFTLPRAATAFTALYAAGGPTGTGSLRTIEVRRAGQTAATIDVYDYALRGDASRDVRLENGDVIFVPPRGAEVRIVGAVLRPATYELKQGETLADLIRMAGGFDATADRRRVQIERILPPAERTAPGAVRRTIDVASALLESETGPLEPLAPGDVVRVFTIPKRVTNTITVKGNVWTPGTVALEKGMRLSDVLQRAGLKPDSYLGQVLVSRLHADSTREMIRAELRDTTGAVVNDVAMADADEVTVFSVTDFRPKAYITMNGAVHKSGRIPYHEGMTLRDAVLLAGGLQEGALLSEAEIARVPENRTSGVMATTTRVPLDSGYLFAKSADGRYVGAPGLAVARGRSPDVPLQPYDAVLILRQPNWEFGRMVTLVGEVRYPARYVLRTNSERLSDLITRAGGLTDKAYANGVVFIRKRNKTGRVGLDLPAVLKNPKHPDNLELVDGDSIVIPSYEPVVTVTGQTNATGQPVNPGQPVPSTAVAYVPGADIDYYIRAAGGGTPKADVKRAYVMQANGKVESRDRHFLLFHSTPHPDPGSTVTVPELDATQQFNWSGFVTATTSILSSLVAIVAVMKR